MQKIKQIIKIFYIPFLGIILRLILLFFHTLPKKSVLRNKLLKVIKKGNARLAGIEQRAQNKFVFSLPYEINLETTMKCNLLCPMCFREFTGQTPAELNRIPDMSRELFDQIAKDLFPTAKYISTTLGGEPFLTKDLDYIIDKVEEYGVQLEIVTNGMLLGRKGLIERIGHLIQGIEISFDSPDPKLFEELRKGARFDKVLKNVRLLSDYRLKMPEPKFKLGFSFTMLRKNMKQLPEMIKLASDVGAGHIRVVFSVIFREEDEHLSALNYPEEYNEIFQTAMKTAKKYGINLMMPEPFVLSDGKAKIEKGNCHFLYLNTFINFKGVIRACCHYDPPIIGEYQKFKFKKFWNNNLMQNLRANYQTEKAPSSCRNCFIINRGQNSVENRKKESFAFQYPDKNQ